MSFEELEKLKIKYIQEVAKAQLRQIEKKQFKPKIPYIYYIKNNVLGPARENNAPYYAWAIVFDNDGVLTAGDEEKREEGIYKTLSFAWGNAISELRYGLKKAFEICKIYFARMAASTGDFEEEQRKITQTLVEAGLKEEEYNESVKIAAKNATIAPGALETVIELEKLGIVPTQCSGSPHEAVQLFGAKRLMIPPWLSEGSRFIFHKGKLVDTYSRIGYNKVKSKEYFLRSMNYSPEVLISDTGYKREENKITDDAIVFANTGPGDLCIWAQRKGWVEKISDALKKVIGEYSDYKVDVDEKLMPGQIKIASEKFTEDLTNIIRPIEIWRRARIMTYFYDPSFYLSIVEDAFNLKQIAKKCEKISSSQFTLNLNNFLEISTRLRRNIEFIFPKISSELDYHLNKLLSEVTSETDIEKQKNLIEQIKNDFEEIMAEIHFDEKDVKSIKEIAEEFNKKFQKNGIWEYV
jgi:phosphoserine phosphatase